MTEQLQKTKPLSFASTRALLSVDCSIINTPAYHVTNTFFARTQFPRVLPKSGLARSTESEFKLGFKVPGRPVSSPLIPCSSPGPVFSMVHGSGPLPTFVFLFLHHCIGDQRPDHLGLAPTARCASLTQTIAFRFRPFRFPSLTSSNSVPSLNPDPT